MEYYRIWRILVGHWRVLFWLPIVATTVALGLAFVLPEQYESTALIVVRVENTKFSASSGDRKEFSDFPVNLSAPVDAPSKTYIEVIKSTAIAMKIVEALRLDVKAPPVIITEFDRIKEDLKTWFKDTVRTTRNYLKYGRDIPSSPFDQAVEDIATNMAVSARKDTYAFDITFRSGDPQQAAAVANMAAEIFLEQSSETDRAQATQVREFTEKQLNDSRKALEQARAAKLAYKNAGGTFELKSEYDEKLRNLSDLENSLAKTEGKLAGVKKRAITKGTPDQVALEAEIAELKDQIIAVKGQLVGYPQKETRLDELLLTERLAQQSYEFFLKQFEEARVKESATTNKINIVSRAVPSLYPVKPVKFVYAVVSFGTALVLAIGWALFVESLDPRVRTIRDLDAEMGAPVLGAIPPLKSSRWRVRA